MNNNPYKAATLNTALMEENLSLKKELTIYRQDDNAIIAENLRLRTELAEYQKPKKHWFKYWHQPTLLITGVILLGESGGLLLYYLPNPWAICAGIPLIVMTIVAAVLTIATITVIIDIKHITFRSYVFED